MTNQLNSVGLNVLWPEDEEVVKLCFIREFVLLILIKCGVCLMDSRLIMTWNWLCPRRNKEDDDYYYCFASFNCLDYGLKKSR